LLDDSLCNVIIGGHVGNYNSPITYNLSNFITGCWSLVDKIIEVLLYH
jgi:hypothetical protein